MRSFFVALFLLIFLILSMPWLLVTKVIGLFDKKLCARLSQPFICFGFSIILKLAGAHVTVLGVENIPTDRPVLFTGNHRSYADIPLAYTTVPCILGFVAKKEVKKFIGLSWWMTNMNCLFLDRNDLRQSLKTILSAIDNVNASASMFIMPEGTRNHGSEMLPFKEGSFKIADKTNCPVIPVAITNSDGLYELHKPWIKKADIVIHYGTPIEVADLPREERKVLGARVRGIIEQMLEEDKKYL